MARRPMSAKQKAALRKAQLASARKRKGTGKQPARKSYRKTFNSKRAAKRIAIGGATVAVSMGVAYGAYAASKSYGKHLSKNSRSAAKKRLDKKSEDRAAIRAGQNVRKGKTKSTYAKYIAEQRASRARTSLRKQTKRLRGHHLNSALRSAAKSSGRR